MVSNDFVKETLQRYIDSEKDTITNIHMQCDDDSLKSKLLWKYEDRLELLERLYGDLIE